MIDEEKARLGGFEPPMDEDTRSGIDLEMFSHEELRVLRREIDRILPDLAGMDLQRELTDQYNTVKDYQEGLLEEINAEDEDSARRGVEPNKMASVINATTTTLEKLIKMQESLDRAETFKKMEACLIEAVRLLPEEARDRFFSEYEALAGERGLL